jgi:WD40 repeat protein
MIHLLSFPLQCTTLPPGLLNLIDDCKRFLLGFFDIIEKSAMHIYHSALPWSPMLSPTRRLYQRLVTTEVKLLNAIDANWDACIRAIPIPDHLIAIAFSHNGSALAVVSEEYVKIFETATGVVTFEVDQSIRAYSVAFSRDDDMLVCGLEDGTVRVWDVQTSDLVKSFKEGVFKVFSVAFSPRSNMVVSGNGDKTVRIWDMSSGRCEYVLKGHSDAVLAVCWSGTEDSDPVISGSRDASVRIWNVSRRTCLGILRGHNQVVTSIASSCDSSLVASGSFDRTVKVYDVRTGDVLHTISSDHLIYSVQFSSHGDKILFTNLDTATIWDLSRKMKVSTINCGGCRATLSQDGTRVASDNGSLVKIWDTENGVSNSETVGRHVGIRDITFASYGPVIATESDRDVEIWDTAPGNCLFTITFNLERPRSIVFSPDSAFIACWYNDLNARVWNVHTRTLVKDVRLDFKEYSCHVALSPCGGRLVSRSSSQTILWDLGSGKHLACLDFYEPLPRNSRIAFAADSDGTSVFIHNGDDITQRWRISSARLPSHQDRPFSDSNQSTSAQLPLIFTPIQEKLTHQVSVPRQWCHYESGEWILDQDGKHILWLPPNRRGSAMAGKPRGKKITVGTYPSKRVYLADFSLALPLS